MRANPLMSVQSMSAASRRPLWRAAWPCRP